MATQHEEIKYKGDPMMFRPLDSDEVAQFRQYAQENDPPKLDWSLYHPVCRAVWMERGFRPGVGENYTLAFGLNGEAPAAARAVWGARAIAMQSGNVELVWDRQDMAGDDHGRQLLKEWLNGGANKDWMRRAEMLLEAYVMQTRQAERMILLDTDEGTVIGDTRGSCGYLYIAAWRKP